MLQFHDYELARSINAKQVETSDIFNIPQAVDQQELFTENVRNLGNPCFEFFLEVLVSQYAVCDEVDLSVDDLPRLDFGGQAIYLPRD